MTEPPTAPLSRTRTLAGWPLWKWAVTAAVAIVAAVLASVAVRQLAGDGGAVTTASKTGQPTTAPAPAATTAGASPSAGGAGGATSAPRTAQPGRTTTRATTSSPATEAPGPRIVVFQVKTKPSCPAGTNQAPIDGTPVTLEWEVAGGQGTQLSVDGPGKYGDFALKDSVTLSFPCSGAPGTDQKHTYTLTSVGGGPVATQTLTVTAKVNEISQVP